MHQDQRIGLALGVLLVGACAAFFFRNETQVAPNVPRLQHAQELDERIAERSNRPYLKEIEAVEASDRSRKSAEPEGRNPIAGPRDEKGASFWSPVDQLDHEASEVLANRTRKHKARLNDSENDIQELAPIQVPTNDAQLPSRSQSTGRVETGTAAGSFARSTDESSSDGKTYVVQRGETLSSIASRFLGSPSRYHEIFDANRDQLQDANDVRQGMTLRIPTVVGGGFTGSTVKPHSSTTRSSAEIGTSEEVSLPPTWTRLPEDEPPIVDVKTVVPQRDSVLSPSIMIPPELPNPIQNEPGFGNPTEPPSHEEGPATKRFIPARKLAPSARNSGPQANTDHRSNVAGRKLSQASLESTSGKVAR